jgi:hypothetical protein
MEDGEWEMPRWAICGQMPFLLPAVRWERAREPKEAFLRNEPNLKNVVSC